MSARLLILGGDGMLGHQLLQHFDNKYVIKVTLRKKFDYYKIYNLFNSENSIFEVEASNIENLSNVFSDFKPDFVINCIGIVKQRKEASDAIESITINALLPHQLTLLCYKYAARLIQISTDCVFTGKNGNYAESDVPDALDLYGRTKLLGEIDSPQAITLRTSIIGLELYRKQGLIEWFLSQTGNINGYARAIYSGFTTAELASIIERIFTQHRELSGIWHVSSNPISKYELLRNLSEKLNREDINIIEDEKFVCDRSLDGSRFIKATGYVPPSWDEMLDALAIQIKNRN